MSIRLKSRVAQVLSHPLVGSVISSAYGNRIPNMGVVIDTSSPAFSPRVKAQLAFGIYEGAEIGFIRKYLRGYAKILELGSSLGVTASHVLDVAAAGAEVVCVEANPRLLPALRATVSAAATRAGATARTIHGAVPDSPDGGSLALTLTLDRRSHLGSRTGEIPAQVQATRFRVPAVDLGSLVADWTRYAVICDIEGAEAALILSAQPALTGASRVVIELHDTCYRGAAVSVAQLRIKLLDLGFRIVDEKGRVLVLDGPAASEENRHG